MTSGRKFYFIALVLALLALTSQYVSMAKIAAKSKMTAKALTLPEDQRNQLKMEAHDQTQIGKVVWIAGIGFAISATVFSRQSTRRGEPVSQVGPVALLGFYVISQFILV